MSFGKYALVSTHRFNLEEEPDWFWEVKPPTVEDDIIVQKFMISNRATIDPNGVARNDPPVGLEIAIEELALTFSETNIPVSEEDPTPVIAKGSSLDDVRKVLKTFPSQLILELWGGLGDAVPTWGPVKKAETGSPS